MTWRGSSWIQPQMSLSKTSAPLHWSLSSLMLLRQLRSSHVAFQFRYHSHSNIFFLPNSCTYNSTSTRDTTFTRVLPLQRKGLI